MSYRDMETVCYIIIAAIVAVTGWIVLSVIREGRPDLDNNNNNDKHE